MSTPDPMTDGKVYLLSDFGVYADGNDYSMPVNGSLWQTAIDTASGFNGSPPGPLVMDTLSHTTGGDASGSAKSYVISTTLLVKAPLTLLGVANPGISAPKILVRIVGSSALSAAAQQGADPFTAFFVNDIGHAAGSIAGAIFRDFELAYDTGFFPVSGAAFHFLNVARVQMDRVRIYQCWSGVLCDGSSGIKLSDVVANPCQSTTVTRSRRFGFKCSSAALGNSNGATLENCLCPGNPAHSIDGFVIANGFNSMNTINCGAEDCDRAFASTVDGGTVQTILTMPLPFGTGNLMLMVQDPIIPTFVPVLVTDVTSNIAFVGLVVAKGDTQTITVGDITAINVHGTSPIDFAAGSLVTAELVGFLTTATTVSNGPFNPGVIATIILGHPTSFALFSSVLISDGANAITGVIVGIENSGNKIDVAVDYSTGTVINTSAKIISGSVGLAATYLSSGVTFPVLGKAFTIDVNDATAFPVGSVVSIFGGSNFLIGGYVNAITGVNTVSMLATVATTAKSAPAGSRVFGGATAAFATSSFTAPAVGMTVMVPVDSGFGFALGDYVVVSDTVTVSPASSPGSARRVCRRS